MALAGCHFCPNELMLVPTERKTAECTVGCALIQNYEAKGASAIRNVSHISYPPC